MLPLFLYVTAILTAIVIGALIWKVEADEKGLATTALLMPVGSAITAYGYAGGLDHYNFNAVFAGDVLFILGCAYLVTLCFRRYKALKDRERPH